MNKSMLVGAVLGAVGVTAGGAVATYALVSGPQYAEVLAVQPIKETIKTPREVCKDVAVTRQAPVKDQHQMPRTPALGLVGLGDGLHQLGHALPPSPQKGLRLANLLRPLNTLYVWIHKGFGKGLEGAMAGGEVAHIPLGILFRLGLSLQKGDQSGPQNRGFTTPRSPDQGTEALSDHLIQQGCRHLFSAKEKVGVGHIKGSLPLKRAKAIAQMLEAI